MSIKVKVFLFSVSVLFLFQVCETKQSMQPVSSGWYFWKTSLKQKDHALIKQYCSSEALYVRILDIAWSSEKNKAYPVAPILADSFPLKWIPVVYVKNEIFYHQDSTQIDSLSNDLIAYMQHLIPYGGWTRFQIDCDWTEKTRDRYFWFLTCIKLKLGKELSVTIRLHQLSAITKMGIPPVGHGVLMCYNMQSPALLKSPNSIYQIELLKSYTKRLAAYPIHLDIAFPLYTWAVVFRGNKFYSLINEVRKEELESSGFHPSSSNWYTVQSPLRFHGISLLENDRIRLEEPTEEELEEGVQHLLPLMRHPTKLIWYHLDSSIVKNRTSLIERYQPH